MIFFFSVKGSDEEGTTMDSRQSDTFMKDDILQHDMLGQTGK